jgi:predicted nucleic acid-binding Zn ribbon protein
MECPNPDCREQVPAHVRHCVVCGADAKVPNVRAADSTDEVKALEQRVLSAEQRAQALGYGRVLKDFQLAVSKSSAVICRSLGQVNDLVSGDNQLFATFYQSVHADARLPEDNEWDKIRQSVDSHLFPYYFHELRFAVVSIDGSGVTGYGDYCIVLKDSAIKERATVFEENTVLFIKRRRIVVGDPIPLGYRATWDRRDLLAVAKLSDRLSPSTTPSQYQSILISSTATDSDFIEVHVHGALHRRAIKELSGSEPKKKADRAMLNSIKRKLREVGATWRARP